jgi:hypothetical protein
MTRNKYLNRKFSFIAYEPLHADITSFKTPTPLKMQ